MINNLKTHKGKLLHVKVTTMDADLNSIVIEPNWTGRQLFDTVCRIIGLREIWFFGLRYVNKKGLPCWLEMEKKINQQEVPKNADGSETGMHFLFLVKFYPEDVEEELIQDITRHLFFLQIKQSIMSMDLYCQPEVSVLLASYAMQATYGDYSDVIHLELLKLLPQSVVEQFDMSADMWEERIRNWWTSSRGLSTEDAKMEYLRVAQDLDMFGIQYYSIYNQKDTDLLLGVSAQGIGIYEISNRLSPRPFFPWAEIRNISFQNKVFVICVTDNSKIKFRAKDHSINASILDLCIGTHNLYLRRRQPDSLEVQQMKAQAREQRQKKMMEQNRLLKEHELRVQAEMERDRYKAEIGILTEQLAAMQSMMKSKDESHKLIAEKARVTEKEALELSKRASEAEAEVQRVKLSQVQAEETKMVLERKVRDAELMAHRLMQQENIERQRSNNGASFPTSVDCNGNCGPGIDWSTVNQNFGPQGQPQRAAVNNGNLVLMAQPYVHQQQQLMPTMTKQLTPQPPPINTAPSSQIDAASAALRNGNSAPPPSSTHRPSGNTTAGALPAQPQFGAQPTGNCSPFKGAELQHLYAEIEKSRNEYYERNHNLKESLLDFRKEIEMMKRDDRQTEHDRIYATNFQSGFDKYSTLRKSGAGSSKSRVKVFDQL